MNLFSCKLRSDFSLRTNTGVCLPIFRYTLHVWTQAILPLLVQQELILCYFVHSYFCEVHFFQLVRHIMFSSMFLLTVSHFASCFSLLILELSNTLMKYSHQNWKKPPLLFSLFQFQAQWTYFIYLTEDTFI